MGNLLGKVSRWLIESLITQIYSNCLHFRKASLVRHSLNNHLGRCMEIRCERYHQRYRNQWLRSSVSQMIDVSPNDVIPQLWIEVVWYPGLVTGPVRLTYESAEFHPWQSGRLYNVSLPAFIDPSSNLVSNSSLRTPCIWWASLIAAITSFTDISIPASRAALYAFSRALIWLEEVWPRRSNDGLCWIGFTGADWERWGWRPMWWISKYLSIDAKLLELHLKDRETDQVMGPLL